MSDTENFFMQQNKQINSWMSFCFLRGALSPHHDPKEHLAVAPCLREKSCVSGLHLPSLLSERLQSPGKQKGCVPELWELDRKYP